MEKGTKIEIQFYLNQSLYIPLEVEVMRVQESSGIRQVGANFVDTKSKGYKAYSAFMKALDEIADAVEFVSQ